MLAEAQADLTPTKSSNKDKVLALPSQRKLKRRHLDTRAAHRALRAALPGALQVVSRSLQLFMVRP